MDIYHALKNGKYTHRHVKRDLEKTNRDLITETGGIFEITGPAIEAHWDVSKTILREDSPFAIAEIDAFLYDELYGKAKDIKSKDNTAKHLTVYPGDVFEMLKTRFKKTGNKLFRYGHLDFCKTATVLVRDHNLIENLIWLAQWSRVKDIFYLDITFSVRGSHAWSAQKCMEQTIPFIFNLCGWDVEVCKEKVFNDCEGKFIHYYREPRKTPMANAIYKMVKKPIKKRGPYKKRKR